MGKNTVKNRTIFFKKRFLEYYKRYRRVTKSARATGISQSIVYRWLKEDAEFDRQFNEIRFEPVPEL